MARPKKRPAQQSVNGGLENLPDGQLREIALGNWVQLNQVLKRSSPLLEYKLLQLELGADKPRIQILSRLYGRLAKRRATEEKKLLHHVVAVEGDVGEDGAERWQHLLTALEPAVA